MASQGPSQLCVPQAQLPTDTVDEEDTWASTEVPGPLSVLGGQLPIASPSKQPAGYGGSGWGREDPERPAAGSLPGASWAQAQLPSL